MKKQIIYLIGISLLLAVGLIACSNDSKPADGEEGSNTADESNADNTITNLLDWETTNFEESDYQVNTIDNAELPEHVFQIVAGNGTVVLSGDTKSFYYDYLNGKMSDFSLDGDGRPLQRNATYATSYFFNEYHYTINGEDLENRDQYHLVEINIDTGEKKVLTPVDSIPSISKSGDSIIWQDDGKIIAFDTKQEEELWQIEPDVDFSFAKVYGTDNAVVLQGDEGLAVFSTADGEKMFEYEAETYLHYVGTDGNDFYVTEESEETMTNTGETSVHVYKFTDGVETPEKLLTTPEMTRSEGIDDLRVEIEGDTLYMKSKYGISAYDKNDGQTLWHTAIGGELVQETNIDGPSHDDFEVSYNNGDVYVRTTLNEKGTNKNRFTVIDGKTGDMKENYVLSDGDAHGPAIDGDRALVFHTDSEQKNTKVYVIGGDN
ncbi:outer membrane protein assembly factor BamB family protein [Gracilibacillus massiliensis]|uniref:outer membrane protein assembly factor BamB family protein n=1 Tax=Gracilibacillus massiliensis TaxID=1564956 RepID=UPI00071C9971|nr:PQQ-binding-like beta-propeller repeat protein [Gracilibacillus massiliensis]